MIWICTWWLSNIGWIWRTSAKHQSIGTAVAVAHMCVCGKNDVHSVNLGALHHKNKSRPFAALTNRHCQRNVYIANAAQLRRASVKLNAIMLFYDCLLFLNCSKNETMHWQIDHLLEPSETIKFNEICFECGKWMYTRVNNNYTQWWTCMMKIKKNYLTFFEMYSKLS